MTNANAGLIRVEKNPAELIVPAGRKMIVARFRNPSRVAAITIPNNAWKKLETVPEAYRPLLEAVLENAAKQLLATYLSSFSSWPTEIHEAQFSEDKILEQASGANTDWMSKEELAEAWKTSATRKAFVTDARYTANPAYRKAVAAFELLILKLSGKTSQFKPEELDKMLAKIADDDLTGEFGSFVVRRIEAIRNKPAKVTEADLDLL